MNCPHNIPIEARCASCVDEALQKVERGTRVKQKKCKVCRQPFTQRTPLQTLCGPACMPTYAEKLEAKRAKEATKAERARTRERKEAIKTVPDLIREADQAFCAYIRLRDRLAGHLCISSGRPLDWSGNSVDAGHFRSRGAASHLRYNEDNCHAQSKHDNRYKGGNILPYRANLIARIGLERVEALENDNTPHKWLKEELVEIRDRYRVLVRKMRADER